MWSLNAMDNIQSPFTCEGCVHAIMDTDQTGCKLNLLNALDGEKSDKYYILDRTCLFKNKTPEEVDVKLGYLFILEDFKNLPTLEANVLAIKDKNPIWIGVSTNDPSKTYQVAKILDLAKCEYDIVANYVELDTIYRLDQFMKNYKNGWTLVNIVGQNFDLEAKDKLDKFVIRDNKKAAVIKNTSDPDDIQINGICYYNFLFKYLNGNKPEVNDQDKAYYTKSFIHKVYEKDKNMIATWSAL